MVSIQVHSQLEVRDGNLARAMNSIDEHAGRLGCINENRPLRVALVASSYNYIRDGVALTLNRLVAYLEQQDVEVLVFAPVGEVAALEHHGTLVPVPSMALPPRPEYRLAFGLPRQAVERLRAFHPDIMHVALAPVGL